MNKKIIAIVSGLMLICMTAVIAQEASVSEVEDGQAVEEVVVEEAKDNGGFAKSIKYIAAAAAVGIACIAGGTAVSKIGTAAMGAMSENAELSGKALPFVGLAEGICLWGFLVALFIILM